MKLDKDEIIFIRANADILENIFKKELIEMRENVFAMPRGEDRDFSFEFIKRWKLWISDIGLCSGEPKEPDSNI